MIIPQDPIATHPGASNPPLKAEVFLEPAAIAAHPEREPKHPAGKGYAKVDPYEADEIPESLESKGLVLFGEMHGILAEPYPLHRY